MAKIYYINGKVVTITEGGVVKVLTTPDDFSFEVVTDIHAQINTFSRVCVAMNNYLSDGAPGDFVWATGDTTAANYVETYYDYQFNPDKVREVIDTQFGTNYPFYLAIGNHDITDVTIVKSLHKNGIVWLRDEYNDITHASFFTREDTGWAWEIATVGGGYPASDWREAAYDHSGWNTGEQGLIGFGDVFVYNPSLQPPPEINCSTCPTYDGTTVTWCFRREFTIADQAELDSLRTVRLETLYDDGAYVYLNGTQIQNYYMVPAADPSHTQLAVGPFSGMAESIYSSYTLSPEHKNLLTVGTNVIAIEVHQAAVGSDDMYCDAALYYSTSITNPREALSYRQAMSNVESLGKETTYAFVHKGCLFVNLNFYYDGITDDNNGYNNISYETYEWLCALFQSNNLPTFVFGHEPISNTVYKSDVAGGFTGNFWQLLENHECVIAYFAGDDHVYRRIQPTPSTNEIWHIVNSPAGGIPRPADGRDSNENDWQEQGYSFMDVSISHTNQEVVFTRWVVYGDDAKGTWEVDDTWTQAFTTCLAPGCEPDSLVSSSSSSQSSSSSSESSSSSISSSSSSKSSSSSSESSSVFDSSSSSSQSSSSSSQSSSSSSSSSVGVSSSSHKSKVAPFILHSFTDEEIDALYAKYHPMLEGLTDEQKEDKLVDLVSAGDLSADKALVIAVREGLILDS